MRGRGDRKMITESYGKISYTVLWNNQILQPPHLPTPFPRQRMNNDYIYILYMYIVYEGAQRTYV